MRDICLRSHSRDVEKKTHSGNSLKEKPAEFIVGTTMEHGRKN